MKNFTEKEFEENKRNYGDDGIEKYIDLLNVDVNEGGWHKALDLKNEGYNGTIYWKKVEGLSVNLLRMDVIYKGIKV